MTIDLLLDLGLAALVLAVAGWTIVAREAFPAVVGFVAYGLLLTLVWVRLAAADVALTEAAIGSGLTGGLLVAASTRLRKAEAAASAERSGPAVRWLAAVLCAAVAAALAAIVLMLPDPPPTLAPEAAAHLHTTGLGNPIGAVLVAYRGVDTLLESVVLLLALLGVWSLAPDQLWGGVPGGRVSTADRSDDALTFLAQLLPPIGIVVGIHIVWVGANAPGGKFQGATILATMWILATMAGLTDWPPAHRVWLRFVLVVGPAVFLAVGLAGFVIAGNFLAYPAGWAKPLILLIEAALTPSVAATLGLLVAGPPARAVAR